MAPHEISNNVACATSKGSDQPAHTSSLIRAFDSRLNILPEHHLEFLSLTGGCTAWSVYLCQNATLLEITCRGSKFKDSQWKCKYLLIEF